MYPELQQFEQIQQDYESQIEQLKDRQKQLQKEKAEASRQYNKTLSKVVYEGDSDSAVELAERKKASNEIEQELKDTRENIEQLQESKKERLQNLVSSLKEGRDREFGAADKHMKTKKDDLLRFRAEYLMLIQQLYDIRKYAQNVDTAFKKTVKPLTHDYEYDSQALPAVNLHNPFGEEDALGILETEVQMVYKTGELPDWAKDYTRE
ncbi:MAG TPA: hypothetical protein VFK37_08965 [Bacillales bacterium]|nr:hypothetical protein [Bacillales bacterium]HEU5139684.1 hypothetical protein [Bacillales bacterium]